MGTNRSQRCLADLEIAMEKFKIDALETNRAYLCDNVDVDDHLCFLRSNRILDKMACERIRSPTTSRDKDDSDKELNTQDLKFHSMGDSPLNSDKMNFGDDIEDPMDDDDDRQDLLSQTKKQPSFWTFEYYQQYFDVESWQVLNRILGSMLPNVRKNYLQHHIRPVPDLYGPFWICTTLVFTTAIAGNMANYIQQYGNHEWKYDFHKG
ncbi:DgyrCDS13495 [Dimorphilus gyrociliatus]|uniref:DgyrCDS13495 n=1 Tax=Dimorphilus gyrociliatus TaxID=2664684 RepID=A0A7I8WAT8_9ANNE|nr:DgyrCDS13495 [Dimorphilus gyrociliatus]